MTRANGYKAPMSGTPAAGGIVTAGDGLSSSVQVSATGFFMLSGIATSTVRGAVNTWTITIASAPSSFALMNSSAGIIVPANNIKNLGTIALTTVAAGGIATGYVFGDGPDYSMRLGNPTIKVGGAGITTYTDAQGFYMLFLPTGTVSVSANYAAANGSYQTSEVDVALTDGAITQVPDFHLGQGGYLTGYVSPGTGALPNIVIQATRGGEVFEDTTDAAGRFYIYATTSAFAYTITPVLDPLQSYTALPSTPLRSSMTAPGSTVFAGTITVVGAIGTISGTVTSGGTAITTGVLVVASTAAVNDPLPTITASVAPSQAIYYSVSSMADGTYSLEVRSSTSTTYNMRAFYPIVDTTSGAVTYTTKTSTGVSVNSTAITSRNFAW